MKPFGMFRGVVLDEFYRQLDAAEKRRAEAATEMVKYDTDNPDDFDLFDLCAETFDRISDDIADIRASIDELTGSDAGEEDRSNRAWGAWATR